MLASIGQFKDAYMKDYLSSKSTVLPNHSVDESNAIIVESIDSSYLQVCIFSSCLEISSLQHVFNKTLFICWAKKEEISTRAADFQGRDD